MDEQRTTPDGRTPEPDGAVGGAAEGAADDAALPPSVQALEEAVGMHGVDATQHAQELLAEHVPLTLLVDLLTPTGETSSDLLAAEGLPDDAWWQDDGAAADGAEPPAP